MCSFFALSALAVIASCSACFAPPPCGLPLPAYPGALGYGPIGLTGCGPEPYPLPPIQQNVVAPTVFKPTVNLPAPSIPPPKIISNFCNCQKKVVKPQVYRKTITVPSVQKVVSTNYRPITETINYASSPIGSASSLPVPYGAYNSLPAPAPLGLDCGFPPAPAPLGFGCGFPPAPAPLGFGCGFPPAPAPLGLGCGFPAPPPLDFGCGLPPPAPYGPGCGCF